MIMGTSSSRSTGPLEIPDSLACQGMPQTFRLTRAASGPKTVILISSSSSKPIHVIEMPETSAAPMIMRSGPGRAFAPMVRVQKSAQDFTIRLPAVRTSGFLSFEATMQFEPSLNRYYFDFMVGHKSSYRNEAFEWRRDCGGKEYQVHGMSSDDSWMLVRKGRTRHELRQPCLDSVQEYDDEKLPGYTKEIQPEHVLNTGRRHSRMLVSEYSIRPAGSNDGNEIVARLTRVGTPGKTEAGEFEYLGTGAAPEIGYHWVLMAAITGVCIYQHQTSTTTAKLREAPLIVQPYQNRIARSSK